VRPLVTVFFPTTRAGTTKQLGLTDFSFVPDASFVLKEGYFSPFYRSFLVTFPPSYQLSSGTVHNHRFNSLGLPFFLFGRRIS